ncbi:MAG: YihY/virulence factor BrkB family protein [Acidimicrobiia bacterium]
MRRFLRLARASYDRYSELHGGELASAVTLAAFLSLLPLLVVGIAALGFVSAASSKDLAQEVIGEVGLSGKAAETLRTAMEQAQASRQAASVVGLGGLLWTGLGVVGALQYTWDTAWQVSGRGLRDKFLGLAWLGGAGVGFVASFSLSAVSQLLPWFLAPLGVVAGFATGVGLWLWAAKVLPNRNVGWRPLIPAAIVGALGFEILKVVGSVWVPRAVASSSALYGSLGVVFAVLAWLLVFGRLVAFTAMVEVVLWEDRHGTVEVSINVPARPGVVPVAATRAGEQKLAPPDRNGPAARFWEGLKEKVPQREREQVP